MQRLRRLVSPPHFVAFARRFHPDASSFAPREHGRHAHRARTISSAAPVDRVSRMESTRPPRFLGNPPVYMPRSSTPADPTTLAMAGRAMLPSAQKTASAPRSVPFRGSITRPAHSLCTLRSRGRPRATQHSVPAGAYPLPGQDFHLQGSSRKFPSCIACYMASPFSRLRLAQFPRERGRSMTGMTMVRRPEVTDLDRFRPARAASDAGTRSRTTSACRESTAPAPRRRHRRLPGGRPSGRRGRCSPI